MAIEFCPLADEIGNMADWVAVGVGAIAAVSTTVVAFLAYRTSERATGIAEEAKGIAQQQHGEAVALRHGTAGILRSLLAVEMTLLPAKLAAVLYALRTAEVSSDFVVLRSEEVRGVITQLKTSFVPTAEGVQEQLHNFEDGIGNEIAGLIGYGRALSDLAMRFDSRVPWDEQGPDVVLHADGRYNFVIIRDEVKRMLRASLNVAPRFRPQVQFMPGNYDEIAQLAAMDD